MCGIVGMAGKIDLLAQNTIFKNLLDVCQLRGRDSTGVVKVNQKSDQYTWVKQVGNPNYLYDHKRYANSIEGGTTASALIGHCRSKTVGEVSIANAHPFDFEEEGICGVHNGTLQRYHNLSSYKAPMTDSEALYGHLAAHGAEKTFSTLEGAFACVWWDNKEGTLNFFRNSHREMWFTWDKATETMFWASEPWMFGAVSRSKELWDGGENKEQFIILPENTLWSFKINAQAVGKDPCIVMKPPVMIPPYVAPVATATKVYHYHNQKFNEYQRGVSTARKGGEVVNPFLRRVRKNHPDWEFLPFKRVCEIIRNAFMKENMKNTQELKAVSSPLSVKPAGLLTGPDVSRFSTKKTTLSPVKSLEASPISGNVVKFDASKSFSPPLKEGVSYRQVAGEKYITDNKTKDEYKLSQFLKDTGEACHFCKASHENVPIGEIISPASYLCKLCIEIPTEKTQAIH
jgi:predicted glutamine amidotransferase